MWNINIHEKHTKKNLQDDKRNYCDELETWVLNKENKAEVNVVKMEYRILPTDSNGQNRERINMKRNGYRKTHIDYNSRKQIKWYGHIRKSNSNRWIKKIIDWSPKGRRKRGKPRRSWR